MECQYCKKILSTISSLNQHQKTVKPFVHLKHYNLNLLDLNYPKQCNRIVFSLFMSMGLFMNH